MKIYGAKKVAEESARLSKEKFFSYGVLPVYCNSKTWTLSTDPDDPERGWKVTELIRENTEEEILRAVRRWLAM